MSAPASSSAVSVVSPRGDDQFAELLHFAALEVARLVLKRFQFPVEISRLAHHVLQANVDGAMIVEQPAGECCKAAGTAWDGVVPPENFSREGALIRIVERALWRATDLIAMAISRLHVKVIGRKSGSSAVASAAYRSGSRLRDERLDRSHDFSAKRGVVHSEVLLPENAPEAWRDRERLWNDVEAFEIRKDAQLAREVEFAIPREMTQAQGIELARHFVQPEFVDRGMIADLNVHWDMAEDGMPKPHAHVMLTMRAVDENGFGQKVRDWNRTEMVERWRERWAEIANERLAELDIDARIEHWSLEAQGIALEPQSQIGAPARRIEDRGIEGESNE